MGISSFKVGLLAGGCFLLQLCAAHLCPSGLQYWSSRTESCVNCSKCNTPEKPIVVRPCQGHLDTECGVLRDLDIDWSWLTKEDHKKHTLDRKHHKHQRLEDDYFDKDVEYVDKDLQKKHHGKRVHKHHDPLDTGVLDDIEVHHNHPHHSHKAEKVFNHHKKHYISSDAFLIDGDIEHNRGTKKDLEDLEKEWKKRLAQSKSRLQHRKEDFMKTLREETKPVKSDQDGTEFSTHELVSDKTEDDGFSNLQHKNERKPLSEMDLKFFEELVNQQHQRQKDMELFNSPNKIFHDTKHYQKHHKDDVAFPKESFDYRSVVPTHRLFLGEPSTITEIMDQDFSDQNGQSKFDKESAKFKVIPWDDLDEAEADQPAAEEMKFSAAEEFIWDWQAVALTSAVAACLLFFAVVAVYSVLHARQWRRLKTDLNPDMEEMSARISLMHQPTLGSSAADGSNVNHYLENLLAEKKVGEKKTNIYIQKPTTS